MEKEQFFTQLENAGKWYVGATIARTNAVPLDETSVFKSYSDAEGYAQKNPLAYPGQIISVVDEVGVETYVINLLGELQVLSGGGGGVATAITWIDVPAKYKHFTEEVSKEVSWKINKRTSSLNTISVASGNELISNIEVSGEVQSDATVYRTTLALPSTDDPKELKIMVSDNKQLVTATTTVYNTHYVYYAASNKELVDLSKDDINNFKSTLQITAERATATYDTGSIETPKYLYYVVPVEYTNGKILSCDFGFGPTDFTNDDAQRIALEYKNETTVDYYIYQITEYKQTGPVKITISIK